MCCIVLNAVFAMVFAELLSGKSGRFEEAVGCQGAQMVGRIVSQMAVIRRISCHIKSLQRYVALVRMQLSKKQGAGSQSQALCVCFSVELFSTIKTR